MASRHDTKLCKFEWHMEPFEDIRKGLGMVEFFRELGEKWVGELNAELHAAQAARNQPVEDGYVWHISNSGSRARLHIIAGTARAQAHEAKHQSILRLMGEHGSITKAARAAAREDTRRFRETSRRTNERMRLLGE